MSTIMIIPAGLYQLPAIFQAKKMGYRVISADNKPNNPGHKYVDRCECISVLDREKMLLLAKEENVNAVYTIASDISVNTVNYIAHEMGLPVAAPYRTIETICLKHRFRDFQQKNGFNYPPFQAIKSFLSLKTFLSEHGFPAILKPSDNSGNKGVFYLGDEYHYSNKELFEIYTISESYSRNKTLCAEKFIKGIEIGGDALIYNGKFIFFELTNKFKSPCPDFVPIGHSIPNIMNELIKAKVKLTLQSAVNKIGLQNGALNFDVMVTNDSVIILEMSPRLGGNCIPKIMEYGTGVNTIEASLLIANGIEPKVQKYKTKPVGVRILRSEEDGILIDHANLEEIKKNYKNIIELQVDLPIGSDVNRFTQGAYRIGHMIVKADSVSQLHCMLDEIEKELNIKVANCK